MPHCLLIILDGYGYSEKNHGNAIRQAKKPYIDYLRENYPTTLLDASGSSVGLPKGVMGNSEVGHFTIGSGRITLQSLDLINEAIKKGSFFKDKELNMAIKHAKKNNSKLHLLGMISDEGVHAHINHLFALLKLAKKNNIEKVYIHAITDGRDVPERSADEYIKMIQKETENLKIGEIATICGRYYAMDRDKNWKRIKKSYDLLMKGKGYEEKDPLTAIKNSYKRGIETDYYLDPIILNKNGLIEKKDAVIFFNFRTDRAAELTQTLTDKKFKEFKTQKIYPFFVCMGPYSKIAPIAFPATIIKNNLGETISKKGLTQLRIAETEKFAHVTFFFNSQVKEPYKNEKQLLIPSPKVPSYDQKPQMSAPELTNVLIKELKKQKIPDLIVLNYANGDLVGHSGDLKASIECVETVNDCLKKLIPEALKKNYDIILTSDHGNAEQMFYPNGDPCPAHTTNPVECTLISEKYKNAKLKKKKGLKDIAPTILTLLKIKKPKEMTGESLIRYTQLLIK